MADTAVESVLPVVFFSFCVFLPRHQPLQCISAASILHFVLFASLLIKIRNWIIFKYLLNLLNKHLFPVISYVSVREGGLSVFYFVRLFLHYILPFLTPYTHVISKTKLLTLIRITMATLASVLRLNFFNFIFLY